jgi:hypothetical protein
MTISETILNDVKDEKAYLSECGNKLRESNATTQSICTGEQQGRTERKKQRKKKEEETLSGGDSDAQGHANWVSAQRV